MVGVSMNVQRAAGQLTSTPTNSGFHGKAAQMGMTQAKY